jgi:predicted RNase H-like HicB family nuclease
MSLSIEIDREDDGRWIAEVPDLPGVFAYGESRGQAHDRVRALALRVIADRLDRGESVPYLGDVFSAAVSPQALWLASTDEEPSV